MRYLLIILSISINLIAQDSIRIDSVYNFDGNLDFSNKILTITENGQLIGDTVNIQGSTLIAGRNKIFNCVVVGTIKNDTSYPEWFGYTGNNPNFPNWADAFEKCFALHTHNNNLNGGTISLSDFTYRLTNGVEFKCNGSVFSVIGAGKNKTIIFFDARETGDTCFKFIDNKFGKISDFTMKHNNRNVDVAIQVHQSSGGGTSRNIIIENLIIGNTDFTYWYGGIFFTCDNDRNNEQHKIINCEFMKCQYAIKISHSNSLWHTIENCYFNNNGTCITNNPEYPSIGISNLYAGNFVCSNTQFAVNDTIFSIKGGRYGSRINNIDCEGFSVIIKNYGSNSSRPITTIISNSSFKGGEATGGDKSKTAIQNLGGYGNLVLSNLNCQTTYGLLMWQNAANTDLRMSNVLSNGIHMYLDTGYVKAVDCDEINIDYSGGFGWANRSVYKYFDKDTIHKFLNPIEKFQTIASRYIFDGASTNHVYAFDIPLLKYGDKIDIEIMGNYRMKLYLINWKGSTKSKQNMWGIRSIATGFSLSEYKGNDIGASFNFENIVKSEALTVAMQGEVNYNNKICTTRGVTQNMNTYRNTITYNDTVSYKKNDMVYYNSIYYVATENDVQGVNPEEHWLELCGTTQEQLSCINRKLKWWRISTITQGVFQ